jgi:hypothetical protein
MMMMTESYLYHSVALLLYTEINRHCYSIRMYSYDHHVSASAPFIHTIQPSSVRPSVRVSGDHYRIIGSAVCPVVFQSITN